MKSIEQDCDENSFKCMQQSLIEMDELVTHSFEDVEFSDVEFESTESGSIATISYTSSDTLIQQDLDTSLSSKHTNNQQSAKQSINSFIPVIIFIVIIVAGIITFFVSGHNIVEYIFHYANKMDFNNSDHLRIFCGCLTGASLMNMFLPLRNIIAVVIGFLAQKDLSNFYLASFVGLMIDIPVMLAVTILQWILTQLWLKKTLQRIFTNSKVYRAAMAVVDCIPIKCQIFVRIMTTNGIGAWICSSMPVTFRSYIKASCIVISMTSLLFVPFGVGLCTISKGQLNADSYEKGSIFNIRNLWKNHKLMVGMFIMYVVVFIILLRSISVIIRQKIWDAKETKECENSNDQNVN